MHFAFKLLVNEPFKSSVCFLGINMGEVWMLGWMGVAVVIHTCQSQ